MSLKAFKTGEHKDVEKYLSALVQGSGAKNSRSTKDYLRFTEPIRTVSVEGQSKSPYKMSAEEYEEATGTDSSKRETAPG